MLTHKNLIDYMVAGRENISDEAALEAISLFPHWKEGEAVAVGDRKQYNGLLYKCIQAHTTQADRQPDITPALWVVVSLEEWPEWVRPTGAHDAYSKDAKVTHNGTKYTSDVDANVWEPGVYGWSEYVQP